jgi:hypothetical protein
MGGHCRSCGRMPSRLQASSVRGVNTPLDHPAVSAGGRSIASEKLFSFNTVLDVPSAGCSWGDASGSTVAGRRRSGEVA